MRRKVTKRKIKADEKWLKFVALRYNERCSGKESMTVDR